MTAETEDKIIKSQTGAASIKPISYTDFLTKVNLNKIGKVGELFRDNPSSTSLRIENSSTSGLALEVETTNIKQIMAKGHVSYVFPIKLSSKYAQSFSNLTVDIKGDTVRAFVNTYKPSLEWIKNWKLKRTGAFVGEVSYVALSDFMAAGTNDTRVVMSGLTCTYWEEVYEVPYQCQGVPHCWPGNENCAWNGTPYAAGYRTEVHLKMACVLPGSGGSGEGSNTGNGNNSSSGGGVTTPNTPYGYEPCDQPPSRPNSAVPPCEEPTVAENLISILGITNQSQIDFLKNPTRNSLVQQMNSYLWANQGSMDSQEFLLWALEFIIENTDVDFVDLVNINNIPNSSINLPILDTSELTNYPAFKALVEDLPNFLNTNPKILKALEATTGFSKTKIIQLMQPGRGPKVRVVTDLKDSQGKKVVGNFNRDINPNLLRIDAAYVNGLSSANNALRVKELGFILLITTLHEFVHYGRATNDLSKFINQPGWGDREAGNYFEDDILPPGASRLEPATAKDWLKYYKIRIIQK